MKEKSQTAVAVIIILMLGIITFCVLYQVYEYERFKQALVDAFNPHPRISAGPDINSPNWDAYLNCLQDTTTTLEQCQQRYPS